MKKAILFFTLIITGVFTQGQTMQHQTLFDTTRVDGQRFVITAPYAVTIQLRDSLTRVNDSTVVAAWPYISLTQSTATFTVNRWRIVDGDTMARVENVVVPLGAIGNNAIQFLTGAATRKQIKKETRWWITRKLNQE